MSEDIENLRKEVEQLREQLHGLTAPALAQLDGRFFHRIENGLVVDRGIVVGFASPGICLLEFMNVLGEPHHQELVAIECMISSPDVGEWHFYDDEDWASRALRHAAEGGS